MANKSFWDAAFSSETGKWDTDPRIVNTLRERFDWDLDVCADRPNVCDRFLSPDDDALSQEWFGLCWMNPPYGRVIGTWLDKAVEEIENGNASAVVCLVPARTDTRWWHRAVSGASLVVFIKGRLKFGNQDNSAPFPSAFIVMGNITEEQSLLLESFGWGFSGGEK